MRYLVALMMLAGVQLANATEQGDWLVRAGVHTVDPKSNNHDVVAVDSATMVTFSGTYFLRSKIGLEVLAALPFTHDINLVSGGKVGETKHLPPTISFQYHFSPDAGFRPYIGVGINVTVFFDEKTSGALAGSDLDLDTSVGLAYQLGADLDLNEHWFLNVDARYFDIETEAKLDAASLGDVEIDPWGFGLSIGRRI